MILHKGKGTKDKNLYKKKFSGKELWGCSTKAKKQLRI